VPETATPVAIRAEFERLVVGDLHGPGDGERELLPEEPTPRDRYLLGMLAPRNERVVVAEFDSATSGTEGESPTEDRVKPPRRMPSSIGLGFIVEPGTVALDVTASWGAYRKAKRAARDLVGRTGFDIDLASESEITVWAREPHGGTVTIPLDTDEIEVDVIDQEIEQVVIRGRVRRAEHAWLVTLFLVNQQKAPETRIDEGWLFQASLSVADPDGAAIFLDRRTALPVDALHFESADERTSLEMLYRDHLDFAVGYGTAVDVEPARNAPTRARRLTTVAVPRYEVRRVEAPAPDEGSTLAALELDMKGLANATNSRLPRLLRPLVAGYREWIDKERARIEDPRTRLAPYRDTALRHLDTASSMADRIESGIALLESDPDAAEAFRFANEAMWRQRVRSIAIGERSRAEHPQKFDVEAAAATADVPQNHRWRVFQLAFVLLNLPSLSNLGHAERQEDTGLADLLFFPTGGGKTEAYLGLAAYTFVIRRLRGTIATDDGALDGSGGIAVLMRYTLRLLTAQQFQRAAALVAACEVVRRERVGADSRYGTTPFRLGLYIGSASSPNTVADAFSAIETARQRSGRTGGYADPLKLERCPWCGTALKTSAHVRLDADRARVIIGCPDADARCPFTERNSAGDGIPVLTTDEEIFRLLPAFLIATVDKFAQLPWRGQLHTLFGRVSRRCERHGYRSVDLRKVGRKEEADHHVATPNVRSARTVPCDRLRPPDLIIQDELHLISGPLGTLVGLYEAAIDRLASVSVNGRTARPKVIASTATIRRARRQVGEIFDRGLAIFPPPGLDAKDNFFACELPQAKAPGRRYVGICARGQRMKAIEARVAIAVLAAGQSLLDRYGPKADPYLTMLAYFNSLRELAGMRRLLDDDVRTRLPKATQRGLGRRSIRGVRELTSRVSGDEILEVLALLERRFGEPEPALDVVLATNMISVGVDVPRLGLMVVAGQPKSTAEYIQATSRVGRSVDGPGLVFTIYNWTRPRDLSHYERFGHDHATFYKQVEALSVTPFASRALDRALTAVIVALVRHEHAHRKLGDETNPDDAAQRVPIGDAGVVEVIDILGRRAHRCTDDSTVRDAVRELVRERLDAWLDKERRTLKDQGALSYSGRTAGTISLLDDGLSRAWNAWSAPNSLRDVEREINLIFDEADASHDTAPTFERAANASAGSTKART
jgi:hypothetical protein